MSQSIFNSRDVSASPQDHLLVDRFGRVHRSLRISVTDICNIRCQYCMPEEGAQFLPNEKLLSFDLIERFVRAVVPLGISNFRLTGGEPLLRRGLAQLVKRLCAIDGVEDLALTTNGMLLEEQLPELLEAGLKRVNISLDTLSEEVFQRLARRSGIAKVLRGIDAACSAPGLSVKVNALVLRDVNLDGVLEMVDFATQRNLDLRFIEFMPLDAERAWNAQRMVSGSELKELIETEYGPLQSLERKDPSRPSRDYRFSDGRPGRIGFINSVSAPFCSGCDRLRLTADGKVRNCLFSQQEWDVAPMLSQENGAQALVEQLRECLSAKHAAHGIDRPEFLPPARAMYQIGG